jgi:hypothetical protein
MKRFALVFLFAMHLPFSAFAQDACEIERNMVYKGVICNAMSAEVKSQPSKEIHSADVGFTYHNFRDGGKSVNVGVDILAESSNWPDGGSAALILDGERLEVESERQSTETRQSGKVLEEMLLILPKGGLLRIAHADKVCIELGDAEFCPDMIGVMAERALDLAKEIK